MSKKEKYKYKSKALFEEENILYEVLVSNEWQEPEVVLKDDVLIRKVLSSARPNLSWFRPLSFSPNVYVPNSIKKLIDLQMTWQFAIGGHGKAVAVLQDTFLEIRTSKDDYSSIVGKNSVRRDQFPQWRKVCWSDDCSLLAVAHSNGELDVFDLLATKLFSVTKPKGSASCQVDCSGCIVDVAFMDYRIKKTRWSSELIACSYKGALNSYYVNSTDAYQEATCFSFSHRYPNGITAFCCHSEQQLIFVGGMTMENMDEAQTHTSASHYEITAWRLLNDEPYYKLVTTLDDDKLMLSPPRSLLKFMPTMRIFQKMKEEAVFKLRLSPNGQKLAVIHTSGSLSIWEVPSLRLFRLWHLVEQPGYNAINTTSFDYSNKKSPNHSAKDEMAFYLIDVNWWSDNALILGRCGGSVTISSILTLKNLLGNSCEWFEPMPQFSAASDKKFLTLECETEINAKKRASIDEDSFEESSDDESFILRKPTKLMKKALYYMTDSEKFQPPRKRAKVLSKTYRLVCLKSTTPEELYKRRMDKEEYGEALALARAYGLDADLVYQRQWKTAVVSVASIQDYLSKIHKRSWVLHECLERVSDDIDAVRELLMYGVKGTDLEVLVKVGKGEDDGRFLTTDTQVYEEDTAFDELFHLDESTHRMQKLLSQIDFNNLTLEQKQLLLVRRKLLSYLARLDTYEVMLGGSQEAAEHFNAKFFQLFRSQSAVDATVEFARNSDWNRVHVMLTYHGDEILEHWLSILSNFPETTNPYEYRSVLPECTSDNKLVYTWEQTEEREQDWCEDIRCKHAVGNIYAETSLYENDPDLLRFRSSELTPSLLTSWYVHRAREIEKRTFFVDNALEIIKLGQEKNVQGLDELYEDLLTLETLVYECQLECTLDEYQSMDDVAKAHLLMSTATDDVYIKQLRRWLIPFLDRRENRIKNRKLEILRSYMLDISVPDLSHCLLVCQNSRSELSNAIITPVSEMIDIALSCVYNCTASDQVTVANCILECLPSRNYGPDTPTMLKLHDWIDELESHLSAAFILNEYGISVTLSYIRKCRDDPPEVRQLLVRLTRTAGKKSPPLKEQQWYKLLDNILELQKILRCVSPSVCNEIFVSSLLCSNSYDNIMLTEKWMECSSTSSGLYNKKVGYEQAVKLVLEAAKEYFNASSSLSDPCMDLAKACLNLISDQPKDIEMELDLISALSILKELNVAVLPLQVRLCEDRIQLIEMALETKSKAYTHVRKLLKLARLMRVSGDDKHARDGRVFSLAASSALAQEDYITCWNLCQQLIEQDHHNQWQICEQLGRTDKFTNLEARRILLSYSAIYCSSESIESLIRSNNLLELQSLNQQLHSQIDDQDTSNLKNELSWAKSLNQTRDFTQQMFRATSHVTKTVISQMVTKNFWQQTDRSDERLIIDTDNRSLERQGCHPFYSDVVQQCHRSELDVDYTRFIIRMPIYPAVQLGQNLLRAALMAESVADTLQACLDSTVLCKLAESTFSEDCALSISYLLALKSLQVADSSLNSLPKSDISLQLSCYYFALQVLFRVTNACSKQNPNYLLHPELAIESALAKADGISEKSDDEDLMQCIMLLKQHHDTLSDMLQGQLLHRLGRGVDVVRFSLDPQYKTNTILGLAMTLDDKVYQTAVSLAARYDIALFQVHVNHLQFLFSEIEPDEIEKRVNRLQLIPILSENPLELSSFFSRSIYPTISGLDHTRLIYYCQLLEKCGCKNTPDIASLQSHIRLLKKIKNLASNLDFKKLMDSDDPITLLTPSLSKDNVQAFAKLANQLTNIDGPLNQSSVYCAWIQKMFYQSGDGQKTPDTSLLWIHRYEACSEFVQKLNARDISIMVKGLVFSSLALDNLTIDTRKEIVRRVLKYSKQEMKRIRDQSEKDEWQKCIQLLNDGKNHLDWRSSEDVEITYQQPELSNYVKQLDLTISNVEEVRRVLMKFVIDGNSISSLQQLVSICPADTCISPADVMDEALRYLTEELKSNYTDSLDITPFKCMQKVLIEIHQHLNDSGDLLLVEDIISALRPFCSDPSVNLHLRLNTLQELEKVFTLEGDDARLANLYRTQIILAAAWPDLVVTLEDVSTEDCRRRFLLDKLLPDCSLTSQCLVLTRLLSSWPPLPSSNVENDVWYKVLRCLLNCSQEDGLDAFIYVFKCWPNDVPRLSLDCITQLFSHIPSDAPQINRLKFLLLSNHKQMHDEAVKLINNSQLSTSDFDEEILDLLLEKNLTCCVVESTVFGALVNFLLDKPDYYKVKSVAKELESAGFDFEAGTLLLRHHSTPPGLRSFRCAFQSLKSWL